jgi:hypothetical protein
MTTLNGRNYRSVSSATTRPADTTAYASGDLVANSTTAASVTPLSWATAGSRPFTIPYIKLQKSGTSTTNASFRIHIYKASPAVATTGDNGAYATDVANSADWLGSYDGTMVAAHSDGCVVKCVPTEGIIASDYIGDPGTLHGLIEVRGAYTPASGEVFTATMVMEFAP